VCKWCIIDKKTKIWSQNQNQLKPWAKKVQNYSDFKLDVLEVEVEEIEWGIKYNTETHDNRILYFVKYDTLIHV
jgi:hypothetical protein